jgi:hypothetical protein
VCVHQWSVHGADLHPAPAVGRCRHELRPPQLRMLLCVCERGCPGLSFIKLLVRQRPCATARMNRRSLFSQLSRKAQVPAQARMICRPTKPHVVKSIVARYEHERGKRGCFRLALSVGDREDRSRSRRARRADEPNFYGPVGSAQSRPVRARMNRCIRCT